MTREISVEDRALINYMKKSIAKGVPIGQSLKNFANMYGDTLKRVNSRWYYGNKQEQKGISLRDVYYEEEGILPYKYTTTKNTSERIIKEQEQSQPIDSVSEENTNKIYEKIDYMHNDMVKYIGNIESSVEKEIKTVADTISSLYENTLALRNLQIPKDTKQEPSYQINGRGEVKKIAPPKEASFSEKKVNAIINDLDKAEEMNQKHIEEIRLLKNERLSLEKKIHELEESNRNLANKTRSLESASENLIFNQKKQTDILKETIKSQEEEIKELSNRNVVERLFNKRKS